MKESFGEYIKKLRLAIGLSTLEVALELGIEENIYITVEAESNTELPLSIYFSLAKVLNTTIQDIVSRLG